ncbi:MULTISPECIES: 50S ribosomal protein L24 [Caloramator]|jgi:large subunit ribosomal protein L24|uniref:Large ribosomal subunit protein uL24 n=1 Tax=Caloramator australicus RC3 TaxID=857293 RepID=I7LGI3_9CLOT|nr:MULTISPECIES: 50S ribosomal protein L24 [Caloramator]MDO6353783.1 50S ribosomal protein L24 [Caloramator sp. CAR-1]WDU83372.1 50S ribosomal protein L24 [Caloramator sp. Dgby_cultured_2]CCJ33300.1 LSU ribosomal protein L24p (L26e) [Caloramator australicus RC3]
MPKVHVKRGDTVLVISGKDKGKKGEVLKVFPEKNRVIVKGVNIVSKHVRPNMANRQGGIIKQEAPIHASNVMLYCTKCNKPTRIAHKFLEDGSKVRVCKHCNETF